MNKFWVGIFIVLVIVSGLTGCYKQKDDVSASLQEQNAPIPTANVTFVLHGQAPVAALRAAGEPTVVFKLELLNPTSSTNPVLTFKKSAAVVVDGGNYKAQVEFTNIPALPCLAKMSISGGYIVAVDSKNYANWVGLKDLVANTTNTVTLYGEGSKTRDDVAYNLIQQVIAVPANVSTLPTPTFTKIYEIVDGLNLSSETVYADAKSAYDQRIIEHQKKGKGLFHIITADSLALLRCLEEERFGNVMRRAELVVPDGAGIVWASDFLGCPLPGRVPGVALVDQLCSMAEKNGLRVFFLGGKPGIAEKAVEKMQQKYPELQVSGKAHGYFKAESNEEEEIMRQIIDAKTNILLVALGVPGQEWFISRFRLTGHKCAAVGVGGSFDVISETLRRAPAWMQQFGIEWLFRLWLEPFRIGRIAKIPAFVLQVFRYKWNTD